MLKNHHRDHDRPRQHHLPSPKAHQSRPAVFVTGITRERPGFGKGNIARIGLYLAKQVTVDISTGVTDREDLCNPWHRGCQKGFTIDKDEGLDCVTISKGFTCQQYALTKIRCSTWQRSEGMNSRRSWANTTSSCARRRQSCTPRSGSTWGNRT